MAGNKHMTRYKINVTAPLNNLNTDLNIKRYEVSNSHVLTLHVLRDSYPEIEISWTFLCNSFIAMVLRGSVIKTTIRFAS